MTSSQRAVRHQINQVRIGPFENATKFRLTCAVTAGAAILDAAKKLKIIPDVVTGDLLEIACIH